MSDDQQLLTTALITIINLELKMAYMVLEQPSQFPNPQKMLYHNIQNTMIAVKNLQNVLEQDSTSF